MPVHEHVQGGKQIHLHRASLGLICLAFQARPHCRGDETVRVGEEEMKITDWSTEIRKRFGMGIRQLSIQPTISPCFPITIFFNPTLDVTDSISAFSEA